MYTKILVAMDMSPMSKAVCAEALALAKVEHAQLLLLHVLSGEEDNSPLVIPADITEIYPTVGNDLTLETWRDNWQQFENQGLELLETRRQEADSQGVTVSIKQVTGSPGKTICQVARDSQADLIVIGRRGRSGLSELILGSVSNFVLHHAYCSVLIVQS